MPKIGQIKAKFHRGQIVGKVKTVTVSYEADRYYASINYEDGLEESKGFNNGKEIGIGMGISVFAYSSDNTPVISLAIFRVYRSFYSKSSSNGKCRWHGVVHMPKLTGASTQWGHIGACQAQGQAQK